MRALTVGFLLAGMVVTAGTVWAAIDAPGTVRRTPVLVELFTSEGCSSCPPADALLARLARHQPVAGAQVIALGEHVDYWDGLGWRDRFSSSQYTARQQEYGRRFSLGSVYTPQMVVDGAVEFVGNDTAKAARAISEAVKAVKLPLTLSQPEVDGLRFSATVSASQPAGSRAPQGDVYAALVDATDTTEVKHGENSGRRLDHVSVVRTLARIGSVRDLAKAPIAFHVTAPDGAAVAAMQVIVFAQQEGAGHVLGTVMSGAPMVEKKDAAPATVSSSGR